MWSVKKNLSNIINNLIVNKRYETFSVFEEEINKNFLNFLDCLKNPVI